MRAISSFLFFGAVVSFYSAFFSPISVQLGPVFQFSLAIASIWTFVAAVGVWMHRRWGAYLYFGLIVASQAALGVMGLWSWVAPIFPGIIGVLLLFCFPRLNNGPILPREP